MSATTPNRPKKTAAAKAEALAQNVPFTFAGQDYVVERSNIDNLELFEAIEDGNYITAVRGFLGGEQWAQFKDAHREDGRVPMSALSDLLDTLMEIVGNLSASPGS